MDVDLLRPGTVPISPDTSLWFEFLLQPEHLEKHLNNPSADPTPTELILKFVTLAQSEKQPSTDPLIINNLKLFSKRCLALKILALKVAASLKWDLELFDKNLPMSITSMLLKDFLYVVSPAYSQVKLHCDLNLKELLPHALFAVVLYHRWVLRAYVSLSLNSRTKQIVEVPVEEVSEVEAEKSATVLKMLADESPTVFVPTSSCFVLPSGNGDPEHSWTEGETLPGIKIKADILMDLSMYWVNRAKYPEARSSLSACLASAPTTIPNLVGLSIAVGVRPKMYKPSLSQQFHEAIAAKYINIDKVLEKDNVARELPIVYRQGLELDISSEVANGKLITSRDAVATIRALNAIRASLDGGVQLHGPPLAPTPLVKAVTMVLPLSEKDKKKLEYFLLQLLATSESHTARLLASHFSKLPLLSPEQISSVIEPDYVDTISHVDLEESSDTLSKSPSLEIAALERHILSSYDAAEISTALTKLIGLKPTVIWDKLNRGWDVPSSLTALNSLPTPFKRNYSFILVAKSYELDQIKNYGQAKALLRNVSEEIGSDEMFEKLRHQLSAEILLVDIHQFHSEWPGKHLDWTWLTERCLESLNSVRGAVREAASLALLNTGAWGPLSATTPSKSSLADLYLAIARASLQISQFNSKVSTEAWDKLIPLFISSNKRRDYKTLRGLSNILEPNALSLVISLLARLHNVLIDQPPLDLYVQLTHFWPGTIKNSTQYNVKQVAETLMEVLEHSLTFHPYNVSWLKLLGDLHFVNGHYQSALGSYLEAAAVATEHFSRPLHRNILEDHIIKRMIKCCTQLQCHSQAGILCQLLEETDYTKAYKCLSKVNPSDASDSYHQHIWDINLLEFLISLHAKKGEHHRKQALVRMIGLLELNSNNNEEIKREAENIRKSHFLRALATQYL